MALQATQGLWMPPPFNPAGPPTLTSSVIDAAGEKFAWIGPVWNKDRASRNITKVWFLPGAITNASTSVMQISLQNVDTATGAPHRPDGTADQSITFNASAVTASTIYQSPALGSTRTVAFGEMLAVVLEYSSFVGTTTFNVQNLSGSSSTFQGNTGGVLFTASWASVNVYPNILLEFDDGTFGTLVNALPVASTTSANVVSNSEVGLKFTVPFSCKVDGAWMAVSITGAGRNFEIILYEDTTPLATVAVDAEYVSATAGRIIAVAFAEQTLSPGTTYYLACKGTTASNVAVYSFTVSAANHFQAHAGGTSWQYSTRAGGAWAAATTTQRPYGGLLISALDDGVSGGGGGGGRIIGA